MWKTNSVTGQLQTEFKGQLISVSEIIHENKNGTEYRIGTVKLPSSKIVSCRIYEKNYASGMQVGVYYLGTATQYKDANGTIQIDILVSNLIFTEIASTVEKTGFDELKAEERVIFNNSEGFPSPIILIENDEEQNKIVERLSDSFKNQIAKYPTASFNGIMAALADKLGHEEVDKGFNFYAQAWNNVSTNKLSQADIQESYNRLFGNIEEEDFDIGIFTSQESNPVIETPAEEKTLETIVEKTNVVTDFVLPIILYLFYISIPIGIFFNTFFKDIFNFRDDFSFSYNENENNNAYFFFFLMFIGGFYLIKEINEKAKNKYIKALYSDYSIKFHFIISMILIAIVLYYLSISIALIILIWSLFKLDGYTSEWKFTKTVFYKYLRKIFKFYIK